MSVTGLNDYEGHQKSGLRDLDQTPMVLSCSYHRMSVPINISQPVVDIDATVCTYFKMPLVLIGGATIIN